MESIQIQTLQRIIRCQDELLKTELRESGDIASVWRNECYRLTVKNEILEEETVRIGTECVDLLRDQRHQVGIALLQSADQLLRDFTVKMTQRIDKYEKRLMHVERLLIQANAVREEAVTLENSRLARRNLELEEQINLLRQQLNLSEAENLRLANEIHEIQETKYKPQTPPKGIDVAIDASPGTVNEVQLLLAELKALEAEAKQMLIKP